MKNLFLNILVILSALAPQLGVADMGIQTEYTCFNEKHNTKLEIQTLTTDLKDPLKKITLISMEIAGVLRPSSVVEKQRDVSSGREYETDTLGVLLKNAPTPQKELNSNIPGVSNKAEFLCHPTYQTICGLAVVDTGATSWSLHVPNLYYPIKKFPEMASKFQLSAAVPNALNLLQKDKIFCVMGSRSGVNAFAAIGVVNKTPIPALPTLP